MKLFKKINESTVSVTKNGEVVTMNKKATVILGVTVSSTTVTTWAGNPVMLTAVELQQAICKLKLNS